MSFKSSLSLSQKVLTDATPSVCKATVTALISATDVDYSTGTVLIPEGGGSVTIGQAAVTGSLKSRVILLTDNKTDELDVVAGGMAGGFVGEFMVSGAGVSPAVVTNNSINDIEVEWIIVHDPIPTP